MLVQALALTLVAVGQNFGTWLTADAYGIPAAVTTVAALTAASGVLVALRMRGTDHNIPASQTDKDVNPER